MILKVYDDGVPRIWDIFRCLILVKNEMFERLPLPPSSGEKLVE